MKNATLTLILTASTILFSCKEETKKADNFKENKEIVNEQSGMDGHTSINSLDWEGTYEGTLPCSDCDGIYTELTINNDNTFILHSTKMKGDKKDKTSKEGVYQWDETGSNLSIEIDGAKTSYKVGENKLILLDDKGQLMPERTIENYILIKKEMKEVN
jgi:uncharacterized lipoprotein NlpE involved in copper resistance